MEEFVQKNIMPPVMKLVNTKAIQAMKDGMIYTIPLIIAGSIFLILGQLPVKSMADAVSSVHVGDMTLTDLFLKANGASFSINALVAVMAIAYMYIKNEGYEPLGGAFVALASFLMISPASTSVTTEAGDVLTAGNVINKDWTGGKAMIGSIIVGLLVGVAYSAILKKDIRIKMPAGVPEGVANAFTALLPAIFILTGTMILEGIFHVVGKQTGMELIYTVIGAPLQNLADSYPAILLCTFLVHFLWFFGVHGATLISGIMTPMWTANYQENQKIFDANNGELTRALGGHVVTQQFYENMITITGSGITIGIAIYCLFLAKSAQYKALGGIAIGPACFNINEPLIFGIPIVMNPIAAVPFMLVPMISCTLEYIAIYTGLCPMYRGIYVPWTTPPVISGFILGGIRTALLQLVVLIVSVVVYTPFMRILDKQALEAEQSAGNDDDDDDW
jgi:PTS system cellobiose-specific IIC component